MSLGREDSSGSEMLSVSGLELRQALALDLARGGYIYREQRGSYARYFDKYLVLSRPGLVGRAASLLGEMLPRECEFLAVTGAAAAVLGARLSREAGLPLLIARDDQSDDVFSFGGESFSRAVVVLVEDVILTGERALSGARALVASGANVFAIISMLDRQAGGGRRLAEAGFTMRSLFNEEELLGALRRA